MESFAQALTPELAGELGHVLAVDHDETPSEKE